MDTKTRSLITALILGFEKMAKMGATQKAMIFTESRRTQDYLMNFLEANGYAGRVVAFNGTNNEPGATAIYEPLAVRSQSRRVGSCDRARGQWTSGPHHRALPRPCDIMVATEAAAERHQPPVLLLVVNYDLPWNPQRIEQRIGRCHRYGQKHDVVVLNFLNERNEADRRVLELLTEKFNLFNGVFGASDDVLGTIESGIDFERRILDIYQQCRTEEEIDVAFKPSVKRWTLRFSPHGRDPRPQALLEHFDEDVHARLKVQLDNAREQMDHVERLFWGLTRFILRERAKFVAAELAFDLEDSPQPTDPPGSLPPHLQAGQSQRHRGRSCTGCRIRSASGSSTPGRRPRRRRRA